VREGSTRTTILRILRDNIVVLIFLVMSTMAVVAARLPVTALVSELCTRIARNSFLVLALIIPVLAGMGLNFGIVIGAMAAQLAIFWGTHWNWTGTTGFLLTALFATPFAILFGWLVGKLFNRIKGMEMIGGLVLGYFADGLYQLLFLIIFGTVIPIEDERIMLANGAGAKNTINLHDTIKYALDELPLLSVVRVALYVFVALRLILIVDRLRRKETPKWKKEIVALCAALAVFVVTSIPMVAGALSADRMSLLNLVEVSCLVVVLVNLWRMVSQKLRRRPVEWKGRVVFMTLAGAVYAVTYVDSVFRVLTSVKVPLTTYLCIAALFVFNDAFMKTRIGHNIRAVGQSMEIANASGIDVDRTRIVAMIVSTVLACWGQLINLQNIGVLSTYYAHSSIGTFSIAALLVGGASVSKANSKQAILGVILFHSLYVAAPIAGRNLFGNAVVGEYFRTFVSYGIIAVSLALHAVRRVREVSAQTHTRVEGRRARGASQAV